MNATKQYGAGAATVTALNGVNVEFYAGQFTAIMGPSGSGKSTLMHCMAGLDSLTSGQALIGDVDVAALSDAALTRLRRDRLGFVFQSFNLVPTLSAAENIVLPLALAGKTPDPQWYDTICRRLGIVQRLGHRPSELSGGQQQRVAVARALIARPAIVFGDEPTGNLDSNATREVLNILRTAVDELGQTVVIVTHDPTTAAWADRVVMLSDGNIVGDMVDPTHDSVVQALTQLGVR
ncbi:ABC transporter ATP-binding protein [Corynebacterium choanae]|uniref:ABC transporter ATP-binding protein n=1 Tax=Corynebacterium choanae TaxID=1862358 RepID=UPI001FE631CB|nr:ABC transporter ATP-binding protein [Corynebacterium choanae]